MGRAWLSRWGGLLLAILTSVVLLGALWPELTIGYADLNDHCYHYPIIARMAQELASGGNPIDFWISDWSFGYAVPRTYQPLGHLLTALLHAPLASLVELLPFFIWLRTILLALIPVTFYASARVFKLDRSVAACVALVSPLIATGGWYGLEWGSHAWRGSGLFTQLWAWHLLPLALAFSYRTMRDGRRAWLAAGLLSATFAAHLVYGYIGAVSVLLLALLPDESISLARRLTRLASIGVMSALCSAWLLLPLVQDSFLVNHSRWEETWKWNSVGFMRVAELAVKGKLLDEGRLPVLTLLALAGLVVCALAWKSGHRAWIAAEPAFARFVLAGSVLWLLLFMGRPHWGPLLRFFGLNADVPLHRLIGGAHLFLVFAAGIALATMARVLNQKARVPVVIAGIAGLVAVAILIPAALERWQWSRVNEKWGRDNLAAVDRERADVMAATSSCATKDGRAYPGLAGTWGRDIKLGSVPLYAFFSMERVPTLAFLYHAMALTADVMVRFDDKNLAQYRAFGVTSVVATDAQVLPPFLVERERHGRFRVLDVPGSSGLFDVVTIGARQACSRESFHDVVVTWMGSDWPAQQRTIALDLKGAPIASLPADLLTLLPGSALPALPVDLPGVVLDESRDGEVYSASIETLRPAWALLKMTYHPRWRFEVDGVAQPIVHVAPGFMAVHVEAGRHELRCEYQPGRSRLWMLLLLSPGILALGFVMERVGALGALEHRAESAWHSLPTVVAGRPRLATTLMLLMLVAPLCLPLLKGELTSGHDHYSYLPRLVEFHENVREGILLPRWAPDLGSGHGQPLFVFAPPMLMGIAELWHLAGLGLVWSINLALIALIVLSAFTMHRFASFHFGREGGWLAAGAYVWAPYFCSDLFVRHALAEFAAFAFYPLALDGLSRLAASLDVLDARAARRHAVVAALGVAGVILSHPPAALLFAPLAAAFGAFLALRARSVRALFVHAAAVILGLALAAPSWLPALAERGDVKMDRLLEGYLQWTNHFVHLQQLLLSRWGFGLSLLGSEDGMSFSLGPLHAALAVVALALLMMRRSKLVSMLLFFAGALVAYALLMSTLAAPIWARSVLLQHVEFPWRMLAPAALCLALLVGAFAVACGERRWIPRLALAALVIVNVGHAWPERSEPINESQWSAGELARRGVSVLTREEYEPRSVGEGQPFSEQRVAFVDGAAEIREQRFAAEEWRVVVRASSPSTLEFRSYSHPGWRVDLDGRDARVEVVPATGFQRVIVPAGDHELSLRYALTGPQRLSRVLAALAVFGCLALVWPWRRREG